MITAVTCVNRLVSTVVFKLVMALILMLVITLVITLLITLQTHEAVQSEKVSLIYITLGPCVSDGGDF